MQPALKLTDQERLRFMQALNAVAHYRSDPDAVWSNLLQLFGELLAIEKDDYQFQASPKGIAEKVNQITNVRARIYFLRMINDIHRRELETIIFSMQKNTAIAKFQALYNFLVNSIRCA